VGLFFSPIFMNKSAWKDSYDQRRAWCYLRRCCRREWWWRRGVPNNWFRPFENNNITKVVTWTKGVTKIVY